MGCPVPLFGPDFVADDATHEVVVHEFDLIVITQSCDLENGKVRLVATSPIYPVSEFEKQNPAFARKGKWNEVLKGRVVQGICNGRRLNHGYSRDTHKIRTFAL